MPRRAKRRVAERLADEEEALFAVKSVQNPDEITHPHHDGSLGATRVTARSPGEHPSFDCPFVMPVMAAPLDGPGVGSTSAGGVANGRPSIGAGRVGTCVRVATNGVRCFMPSHARTAPREDSIACPRSAPRGRVRAQPRTRYWARCNPTPWDRPRLCPSRGGRCWLCARWLGRLARNRWAVCSPVAAATQRRAGQKRCKRAGPVLVRARMTALLAAVEP
jgi:hypothetical protein